MTTPADLIPVPQPLVDARILEIFGAPPPPPSVAVADKPHLGAAGRYTPEPPLHFVIELVIPAPITQDALFAVFTQAWFAAKDLKLCGQEAGGRVVFVGTPASRALLERGGIVQMRTYERVFFALDVIDDDGARSADVFEDAIAAIEACSPWSVHTEVSPIDAAIQAILLAPIRDIGDQLDFILTAPGGGFDGRQLWQVMHALGLRWGDSDCFHWETDEDWEDPSLFHVETSTPPGYFLPEEIAAGKRYADLRFALAVGAMPAPVEIARAMIAFGEALRERLGGQLEIDGEPLDPAAFVDDVADTAEDLASSGFPPGDPATRTLLYG